MNRRCFPFVLLVLVGVPAVGPSYTSAQGPDDGYEADRESSGRSKRVRRSPPSFPPVPAAAAAESPSSVSSSSTSRRSDREQLAIRQSRLPAGGFQVVADDTMLDDEHEKSDEVDRDEVVIQEELTQKEMETEARNVLVRRGAFQQGLGGIGDKEELRPPRARSTEDPERQVLTHVAIQLFEEAAVRANKTGRRPPVEIQLMKDTDHNICIAANDQDTVRSIREVLADKQELRRVLTTKYASRDTYSRQRSERCASKLSDLLEDGERAVRVPEAKQIVDALVNKTESRVKVLDAKVNDVERTDRHAEEYLVDEIERQNDHKREYVIAGKKRPCMACAGRMEHANINRGFEIHYGEHNGRLFLRPWRIQPDPVARTTFEVTKRARSAVTSEGEFKRTDYDTASDSDTESDSENESDLEKYRPADKRARAPEKEDRPERPI